MKAVRSGNEIAYVGKNSWKVRQEIIKGHQQAAKGGSWSAFFNPHRSVCEVSVFQATNQFFEEVNTFWLQVENDEMTAYILADEKQYILDRRKTTKGRVNMAMDRGGIVRHKLFKDLRSKFNPVELRPFSGGMTKVFGAVFAAYVVETETPEITKVLHGATEDVLFWDNAVMGVVASPGFTVSFRRWEAIINLPYTEAIEVLKDINGVLDRWHTRYGVILKNDNDHLGIILERTSGGEIEDSYQFWFEDYKIND
jgi:hypothetical protein